MAQDSSRPDFWDQRYRGGVTPWDAGRTPVLLQEWLSKKKESLRVLVPGCGSGYEVRSFADLGHDVLAIDFSDAALEAARRELGALSHLAQKADFFHFEAEPFDIVYERALLCALPRAKWPQWGRRLAHLVRVGGELAGFFYFDDNERGPPFGVAFSDLQAFLSPAFVLDEDLPVPAGQSLPVFQGKERWQVWKRQL